jgi:hypothetical protein
VLLRKDLGGRHQRDLVAVLDGDDGGFEGNDGFSGADVTLQQAPHGIGLLHVGGDLFQDALLRTGRVKRKNLLDGFANPVIQTEGDSGLCFHLTPLEFEAQFDEEQFLKNKAHMSRRPGRLQVREALAGIGPVHLPQSFAMGNQSHAGAHDCGNGVGRLGRQAFKGGTNHAAKPARSNSALSGGLVDRHDASDLERLTQLLIRRIGGAILPGLTKNLELRLHDLQFAVAIGLDLAVERYHLPGLELVSQVGSVEPETFHAIGPLPGGHLKDGHAAGAQKT